MAQMVYAVNSRGGYASLPRLSKKVYHQAQALMRIRQFASQKEEFGKSRGQSWNFDKVSRIDTAGGTLAETNTVTRNGFTMDQGTGVIYEWGNAADYTKFVQDVSEISIKDETVMALTEDQARVLDAAVESQMDLCAYRYVPLGTASSTITSNGTAGGTAAANFSKYHAKKMTAQLKRLNAPTNRNGGYFGIMTITAAEGIYDDLEDMQQYTSPEFLARGEVGRYFNVRYVEETNAMDDSIGTSDVAGEAYIFGRDTVKEGVAVPPYMAYEETDFGRSKSVAWLATLGFKLIWEVGDVQHAIIKLDSA